MTDGELREAITGGTYTLCGLEVLALLDRIAKLRFELEIHAGETCGCEMSHKAREVLDADDEVQK